MKERTERAALLVTPILALATVAIGLSVGASSRILGARVYAASEGAGRRGMALRLVTIAEERGVPEVVEKNGLTVTARAEGKEAEWHGASNSEGVAEAWLDLSPSTTELLVRTDDGAVLAEGSFALPAPTTPDDDAAHSAPVRPIKRTGSLRLDVFIYGGRLVPGAPTRVAVRVRDATTMKAVGGVEVKIDAEPGLTPVEPFLPTSDEGWSVATVRADFLVVSWTLHASAVAPAGAQASSWDGALPVSPGGDSVSLPLVLDGTPYPLHFSVPQASKRLYVDIEDAHGRDFGAALDVTLGAATAEIPRLVPGLYWLVTSSDPRGAETLTGSTVARPFRVGAPSSSPSADLATLVELVPPKASRTLVLDGLRAPKERAGRARRQGLVIALGALGIGGALELFLLARASARARKRMQDLTEAALLAQGPDGEAMSHETPGSAAARVVIVGLLTLLGFALLAALLLVRGG